MQNWAQYKVQNLGALLEVKRKMGLGFLKSHKNCSAIVNFLFHMYGLSQAHANLKPIQV